jgi:ribosome-binding factor A
MQGSRIERVASELRQEIARILQRELKDPGLGFVTITHVELTKDLSVARVSYSCLGSEEERRRCQLVLDRSTGYIHSLIRKRFRLKTIPAIRFRYDPSIEASVEIEKLLDRIKPPATDGQVPS